MDTITEPRTAEDLAYLKLFEQQDVLQAELDAALLATDRSAKECARVFAGTPAAAARTSFDYRLKTARERTKQ